MLLQEKKIKGGAGQESLKESKGLGEGAGGEWERHPMQIRKKSKRDPGKSVLM